MYTRTALVHQGRTESESEWSWILCSDSAFQSLEWAVIIAKAWGESPQVPLAVSTDAGIHSCHARVNTEE